MFLLFFTNNWTYISYFITPNIYTSLPNNHIHSPTYPHTQCYRYEHFFFYKTINDTRNETKKNKSVSSKKKNHYSETETETTMTMSRVKLDCWIWLEYLYTQEKRLYIYLWWRAHIREWLRMVNFPPTDIGVNTSLSMTFTVCGLRVETET